MNQASLLRFLKTVISSASDQEVVSLTMDDSVETIPAWDSLVTVSIAAALAEELGVKLDIDDLEKLTSVESIFQIISRK